MRVKSSVVIARLLDSDGFNDHVQNIVEKYWLNKICNPGGRKKHRRLERDITEMCTKLTDGEKLVLGKFISMHKAMAFQTGLRIGITAFACKNCREYEVEGEARRKSDAPPKPRWYVAENTTSNSSMYPWIVVDANDGQPDAFVASRGTAEAWAGQLNDKGFIEVGA